MSIVFSCKISEKRVFYKIYGLNKVYYDLNFSKLTTVDGVILIDNSDDLERLIDLDKRRKEKLRKSNLPIITNKNSNLKKDNSSDKIKDNTNDIYFDVSSDFDLTSDRDLSSDKKNLTEKTDETEDKIDLSKYMLDVKRVNYFRSKKDFLKKYLFKQLSESMKKNSIELLSNDESDDNTSDNVRMVIEIFNYNEGEFNLIKNIPTEIAFNISIIYGKKQSSYLKKWYICESLLEFPTENLRLSKISKELVKDITKLVEESSEKKIKTQKDNNTKKK